VSKIAVLAKITAKEGQRDALVAEFEKLLGAVQSEEGTLVYALHTAADDPDVVWFYELYTDQEALSAHGKSEAMKAAGPSLGPLMAGRPEIIILNPHVAKGLSF
jgi:quinol monooxygenase YgiN